MAKKKKAVKAKEPIRLRFKELSNGNKSIYLDIYRDGKRSYEFLKLYIVPDVDETSRITNANTLQAANAIKAQRIIELANSEAGITKNPNRSKMLLIDWMREYSNIKLKNGQSVSFHTQINEAIRHLILYKGESVIIGNVDKSFCIGFIEYLKTAKKRNGVVIASSTASVYFGCFSYAMSMAEKKGIILNNPIKSLFKDDKIKAEPSKRGYLTIDEVKRLISTKCTNEATKKAFLFSCFCGLRISDIKGLKWDEIENDSGQYRIAKVMKKTNQTIRLPLSDEAVRWLPTMKNNDAVFSLPTLPHINNILREWATQSGISKDVTFHMARHGRCYFSLKTNSLQNLNLQQVTI